MELANGPWQEAHQGTFVKCPLSVREAVQPSSKRRPSQTLNDFAPFLSVKDMQCLRDENIPTSVKIDCIVTRMLVLGLHLPTEPTVKAVAGAAMAAGLVCSTAVDGLTLVREIKRRLKQNVKSRAKPANHVVEYPSDPSLLPDSIREVWHTSPMTPPTPERPSESDVQNRASSLALRCTSRLLRPQNQFAVVPIQPSSSSSAQANLQQTMMMHMFSQFGHFMQQQMQQQQPTQADQINLQIYGSGSRRTSLGATPAVGATVATTTTVATPTVATRAAAVAASAHKRQHQRGRTLKKIQKQRLQGSAGQGTPMTPALQLPALPDLPPPDQMDVIANAATKRSAAAKATAKCNAKAKAKAKGKAKCKAKAKAKSKAMAKPDVADNGEKKAKDHGKAKAKAKAQAVAPKDGKDGHEDGKAKGIDKGHKAKEKGKATTKAKAKARTCLPSSMRNRPPVMQVGDPTVYHEKGKIP